MIDFRYPYIFYLYIPLFLFWIFIYAINRKNKILPDLNLEIRSQLLDEINIPRYNLKSILFAGFLLVLIFASTGPQIGKSLVPAKRKGVDLVFSIDVSESMNAQDVKPSRLEKAKFEISQMLRNLKGDRVAFIVFAGTSHMYLPLTTDYEAAALFLDKIDTNMIPTQGTSLSSAIQTGLSAFTEDDSKYKVLILVTDGEDHEGKALSLVKKASNRGMIVHTVGVGTISGSLIPFVENKKLNYKRDKNGKLITSILNETMLTELSRLGKGSYTRFDNNPANFKAILNSIDSMDKRTLKSHVFSEYEDRYQYFVFISLILKLLSMVLSTRTRKLKP